MDSTARRRSLIRRFLAENFLLSSADFPFSDTASLLDEGVVDSTGVLELIQFLEETFGVAVADAEAVPQNLDSVQCVVEYLARKMVPVPTT